MTQEIDNPGDPLFLVSRDLDGDLSKEERVRLNNALSSSESLRTEAGQLQNVDRIVKQWGAEDVEIDWKHHAELVTDMMRADLDENDLHPVDDLLAEWARRRPLWSEREFAEGVLRRIEPSRQATTPVAWAWRIGAPLSAAAAIALAVTASLWFGPHPTSVAIVSIGHVEVNAVSNRPVEPRVVVSYARPTTDKHADASDAPGIGYMTIGSSPLPRTGDESAPL